MPTAPSEPAGLGVGVSLYGSLTQGDPAATRALLARTADAGCDHVTLGDHVSFHDGSGFDGMIGAAAVLAGHDRLPVLLGVYLLALRHPLLVARQLSTLAALAPGRLTLGVGVGGDDRDEVANCGVDPATRGRRTDEALEVLGALADGSRIDHDGAHFTLRGAQVLPAPEPRVPLVIGGGGEPAIRRTARYGDGWLGMFCSARRYAETRARIVEAAGELDRPAPEWFGFSTWCGFDDSEASARERLSSTLESTYHLPGDRFKNVTAAGTPEQVAEQLAPYVAAGARSISIMPAAESPAAGVEAVGRVREALASMR